MCILCKPCHISHLSAYVFENKGKIKLKSNKTNNNGLCYFFVSSSRFRFVSLLPPTSQPRNDRNGHLAPHAVGYTAFQADNISRAGERLSLYCQHKHLLDAVSLSSCTEFLKVILKILRTMFLGVH